MADTAFNVHNVKRVEVLYEIGAIEHSWDKITKCSYGTHFIKFSQESEVKDEEHTTILPYSKLIAVTIVKEKKEKKDDKQQA